MDPERDPDSKVKRRKEGGHSRVKDRWWQMRSTLGHGGPKSRNKKNRPI